jgi:hypothetical protein
LDLINYHPYNVDAIGNQHEDGDDTRHL